MATTKQKLTKKQRGFVKDYVETGNGVVSAMKNYDVKDYNTAAVIASENIIKPNIVKAIDEALGDSMLATKHMELLNAVTLERLSFKLKDTDEEIRKIVSQLPGYEVIHIREDTDGKVAYVRSPDSNTQDKALDKAYKIKGTYAPEKKVVGTFDIGDEQQERAKNAIRSIRSGKDTDRG